MKELPAKLEGRSPDKTKIESKYTPIPDPWIASGVEFEEESIKPIEDDDVSEQERQLAEKRKNFLRKYHAGSKSREEVMKRLRVGRSQFFKLYEIYRRVEGEKSFVESGIETKDSPEDKLFTYGAREFVRKKRGPRRGLIRASPLLQEVLQRAYDRRWRGPGASYIDVARYAGRFAKRINIPEPTLYVVTKFIKSKPIKERDYRKLGKDEGDQEHRRKGKKSKVGNILSDVQMDHTEIDVLAVHHIHRDVIVGRPWITMLICMTTRVILGFYISMSNPNIQTVQNALVFAVLRKDDWLRKLGIDPLEYAYFGLMKCIRTDNAAEFISKALLQKCKDHWGIDWIHRPKDKKWYGGHIERVIGTFMGHVRFVPGATGRNVGERKYLSTEKDASLDIYQIYDWVMHEVIAYHGIKHRELKCTPSQAWDYYAKQGVPIVPKEDERRFLIDFLPSEYRLTVHPYGINFSARRYDSEVLNEFRNSEVDIRYDQWDLSEIWVLLNGVFIKVPCTYTRAGLPTLYEAYRIDKTFRQHKKLPGVVANGMIDDPYAGHAIEQQLRIIDEANQQTADYKRLKKEGGLPEDQDDDFGIESDANAAFTDAAFDEVLTLPLPKEDAIQEDWMPRIIIDPLDF
ncbi:transposase [Pseudomonas sp. LS2P72]